MEKTNNECLTVEDVNNFWQVLNESKCEEESIADFASWREADTGRYD